VVAGRDLDQGWSIRFDGLAAPAPIADAAPSVRSPAARSAGEVLLGHDIYRSSFTLPAGALNRACR
jgi:hypothetical protein